MKCDSRFEDMHEPRWTSRCSNMLLSQCPTRQAGRDGHDENSIGISLKARYRHGAGSLVNLADAIPFAMSYATKRAGEHNRMDGVDGVSKPSRTACRSAEAGIRRGTRLKYGRKACVLATRTGPSGIFTRLRVMWDREETGECHGGCGTGVR